MENINSLADQQAPLQRPRPWIGFPLLMPLGLILGTGKNDTLSAQAPGDIISGLDGNDKLSSAFSTYMEP